MKPILEKLGSLWLAAVLLVLLLVAMGYATVYETIHGTERALADFYHAWWFEALLALLGVNVLAAMLLRYPFNRRHVGFLLTHGGIVATLLGAWITQHFAIDGRVTIMEGQTVASLSVPESAITLLNRQDQSSWSVALGESVAGGFEPREHRRPPLFQRDDLQMTIRSYLPDSRIEHQVVDDNPEPRSAIEVSLTPAGSSNGERVWIFESEAAMLGPKRAAYRVLDSAEQVQQFLARMQDEAPASGGSVQLVYRDTTVTLPLEDCLKQPVAVGDTGYTIEVLRYLPHATVGAGNELQNLSDRPVNPAIEAQLSGPHGSEKRIAFARFPDFRSMHLQKDSAQIKMTFVADPRADQAPLEIVSGPGDELHVCFADGEQRTAQTAAVGQTLQTPWLQLVFTVHRRYANARVAWTAVPVEPPRPEREPALLVGLKSGGHESALWVQKFRPRPVSIDGEAYLLSYADRSLPMGFEVKLNRFRVGHYPGGGRPRSFESHITFIDRATGGTHDRVVSMNHPAHYKGLTFYQSSYRQDANRTATVLSVSRDPGKAVVFGGYVATMCGMLVVLGLRMADRRARAAQTTPVVQLQVGGPCLS